MKMLAQVLMLTVALFALTSALQAPAESTPGFEGAVAEVVEIVLSATVAAQTTCDDCHVLEVWHGSERELFHSFPGDGETNGGVRECQESGGGHSSCHEGTFEGDCTTHDSCDGGGHLAAEINELVRNLNAVASALLQEEWLHRVGLTFDSPADGLVSRIQEAELVSLDVERGELLVVSCGGDLHRSAPLSPLLQAYLQVRLRSIHTPPRTHVRSD